MKLALVTGSTGFVGSRLCRELHQHGYRVRALHRKGSNLQKIKDLPIEFVEGDLNDIDSLERAVKDIDYVFHIAALYREAKFPDKAYWHVNYEGTKLLVELSAKAGVKKFIHCSTIGVHSSIQNPPANENEPYAPTDLYQETKVAAEKYVLEAFQLGKIKGCVIRPAMIWGPQDKRFLKFFRGIYQRKFPLIGNGKNFCHWILVDDLVRAFRLAAETDKSDGQVYIIAGDKPVTLEHTMKTIAETYNVKLLPFKIPVLPVQILGSVIENLCKPFGLEPPLHRRRADFFIKNRAFDCSKALNDLGFRSTYNFEDETRLVANWYLQNKWL